MIAIWRAGLRRWLAPGLGVALTVAWCVAGAPAPPAAAATTTITVNGTGGRTFDGIGAISGGGGNTRLLTDYPAAQQSQILDYLFKPGYGAALQILKVEIGGDTNSTDGSESSIEHASGSIDCNTGYEWWLMQQAKARNPNIKLYGLAWGAPGWIGSTFLSTNTINYIVAWLNCAKSHGLHDQLPRRLERARLQHQLVRAAAVRAQRRRLLRVQIVGADTDWTIANDLVSNTAFASAVQIVGAHYPCGYLSSESSCPSTANAVATGKPLWASENGSQDFNGGAAAMARADNRDYLDGQMTATINWPIVAAIYPDLPFNTDGLIVANQPWSGAYSVGKQLWVTAQTTQFTAPGWTYIDSASGYLQGNRGDGSYVTLKSTNGSDWSSIIETMDATAAQTVTYNVTGGLSTGTVHVWSTNVSSASPSNWFVHSSDITPSGGSFSLTVQPGFVYSLTTTTGQGKGTAASPARAPWPCRTPTTSTPTPSSSSRATSPSSRARSRWSPARAATPGSACSSRPRVKPIEWAGDANPYTIGGNLSWANYTVAADVLIQQAGAVQLLGRVSTQKGFSPADINAYYFQVANTGAWSIFRNNTSGTITTLASGTRRGARHRHLAPPGTVPQRPYDQRGHRRHHGGHGHRQHLHRRDGRPRGQRLPDRPVRQPVGDAPRLGHADRADHRRRQHRQVRRRQLGLQRQRHQDRDVGLQRHRRAELDHRDRRHHPDQRLLHGHHRRRDRQRHPGRAVDLQRRRQPAVAAGERDAGQPGVRPVPGRPGVHHHQRHPTGDLGLQRRLEPAVGDP